MVIHHKPVVILLSIFGFFISFYKWLNFYFIDVFSIINLLPSFQNTLIDLFHFVSVIFQKSVFNSFQITFEIIFYSFSQLNFYFLLVIFYWILFQLFLICFHILLKFIHSRLQISLTLFMFHNQLISFTVYFLKFLNFFINFYNIFVYILN